MINSHVLGKIQNQINSATLLSGREIGSVKLMAVSKTRTREEILTAKSLGISFFGENRVLEALEKFQAIEEITVDLIGQLQSNKVKKAVGFFNTIQSVDSLKLAKKIAQEAQQQGIIQSIFLEQNCSGEVSKSGFINLEELRYAVEQIRAFSSIKITGLMTIAPFIEDEKAVRGSFASLRHSFHTLKGEEGLESLRELSMGMSGDYQWAIEEGSTLVRIGSSLFGARSSGAKID